MENKANKKNKNLIVDRILILLCTVLIIVSAICTMYIIKDNEKKAALEAGNNGPIDMVEYGKLLEISAEYKAGQCYVGTYLNKNSINVYGTFENGGKRKLSNWEGVLGPVKEGDNTFTIEYNGLSTMVYVNGISLDSVTEVKDYIIYDFDTGVAEIIADEIINGNGTYDDAFDGVLMCGDSRTLAISTMKVLEKDKILAKNGVGLDHLETYMQKLLVSNPKTIILNYGVNSISEYENGRIELVEKYKTIIQELQQMLPSTRIIVAAVFPTTDYFALEQPRMNYIEDLNLKLLKMCIELNIEFVDSTAILEENEYLYNPDGLHFDKEFYSEFWLKDLIIKAGIGAVEFE